MKIKKTVTLLITLLCLCAVSLSAAADTSPVSTDDDFDVVAGCSAQAYVLLDADTLDVISAVNGDVRLPMASTTKMMTALVALKHGKLDDVVTITDASVGVEGSSIYLYAGERLTLSELLYGVLLESANDASVAVALHVGGTVEKFVELMNREAEEMGLENTHFTNPHGLHNEAHYSSACDLGRIIAAGLENPEFVRMISTKSHQISKTETSYRYLSNHNRLLGSYEGYIGGKTGYTTSAGRCLVSAASRGGATLIAVTLNDPDDWADHRSLLDYGFSGYETFVLAEPNAVRYEMPVVGGVLGQTVLVNRDAVSVTLRSGKNIACVIEAQSFLYAPVIGKDTIENIAQTDTVAVQPVYGEAVYYQNRREIARVPLYALTGVERYEEPPKPGFWGKIWSAVKSLFE